ncbi:MAG: formate--tetrahydrofolate ligase [Nitrospinaceae bacterium]|nr:formate--tetrahydrofolate ligase [Nitrospinaceae bacterium]NIR56991.1 formate--tetrahydrofolate ligase [Nitrospinaceae bacterium]NIS87448.1 formate--tetrahydrofolate ligase [Nitrospinaceae bacterium]NIT84297.1 formate--tetrahydrofolate ligase [Nitrospinaceae bacterium]NIU46487.1 formate--tetrahydrofolate ligase [Nitrospinaceae bacterium]
MNFPSGANIKPITQIAAQLGLRTEDLILYGESKAKVRLGILDRNPPRGKLILVSAITPTPAGEGKTTTTIGLGQALAQRGQSVCLALREPSLGPCLGMKGGATGGGRSQVHPAEEINLHFTGDFHAITSAHNLLAALLDNRIYRKELTAIDPRRITWKRVMDMNDRALRDIVIGLGGVLQGIPRETGFDITAASEIMAILCLAKDYEDLKQRLDRILVGFTHDGNPVTAGSLNATGALAALLKDALLPNLVQTTEGVPAFIHGGPFANIAHGCNSVIATKMAMGLADWAITEAGFGFDLGAEKFFDIKCQGAGLDTAAVVLVATCRALKMHGGVPKNQLTEKNLEAVSKGLANLDKHVENIRKFCEPPVVCLNRFATDHQEEIEAIRDHCQNNLGVPFAVSHHFEEGGRGGLELADAVMRHAEKVSDPFTPLYDWREDVKTKIWKVANGMYGAEKIEYTKQAERDLKSVEQLGYSQLPVCIAKTQQSLSDNPKLFGRPTGFAVTVREIVISAGAGFLVPITGEIMRMPGLPKNPQAENIDVIDGNITGVK